LVKPLSEKQPAWLLDRPALRSVLHCAPCEAELSRSTSFPLAREPSIREDLRRPFDRDPVRVPVAFGGGNPRSSRDDDSYRREPEEEETQRVKGRCARGGPCECSRTRRAESRSDFDGWRRSPCGNALLRIIIGEQHPVSHSSPRTRLHRDQSAL